MVTEGTMNIFTCDKMDFLVVKIITFISLVGHIYNWKIIKKHGFMREDFFMYGEETDYCYRLKKLGISGKTIILKIKYSDFVTQTRSSTKHLYISEKSLISKTCEELLYKEKLRDSVRLIGIAVSNFKQSKEKKINNNSINAQLKIDF